MLRAQRVLRFVLASGAAILLWAGTAQTRNQEKPSAAAQPKPQHREASPEKVTSATIRPIKFRVGESCPLDPKFTATIETNGATTVQYEWLRSSGKLLPEETVKFAAAGSKQVTWSWKLGAPGKKVNEWVELQIHSPNRLTSNKVPVAFTCASDPTGGGGHPKK